MSSAVSPEKIAALEQSMTSLGIREEDLLEKFYEVRGEEFVSDRMLLV